MKLNLGNKIRELRKRDGRTQDALAEVLGVSAQAVSRWESGGSYPDMEMLPAIANFFHISIDELFGYHDDREEKIKDIVEKASENIKKYVFHLYQGCLPEEFEECVNMLRAASEEFPNEPKILCKFAEALYAWGWSKYGGRGRPADSSGVVGYDTEYNSKNVYWQEAARVFEKALKAQPAIEDKERILRQLTKLYCMMGEYEKAKSLANAQNSVEVSKEALLPHATEGEERVRYQSENIAAMLTNLEFAIAEAVATRPEVYSSEYGREVVLSVINLYETIFNDGNFGGFHGMMGNMYLRMSSYEAEYGGSIQKSLEYFDKSYYHYSEAWRVQSEGNSGYTAPLVSALKPIEKKNGLLPMAEFLRQKIQIHMYSKVMTDEIRKNPKYAELFE